MMNKVKAQSILEYLAVLIMAILAITGGTILFNTGVDSGLKQAEQHLQGVLPESVDNTYQGQTVNYNPETQDLASVLPDMADSHQGTVVDYDDEALSITIPDPKSYEGRPYFEDKQLGGYYYHEGESDMSNVPEEGEVVGRKVVEPEPVTPFAW